MEFFNKKEEVIYIEFTRRGRQKLQEGLFRPVYYSFHDKDIIYDAAQVANVTEVQNDIEDRIFETPRLKFVLPNIVESNSTKNRGPDEDIRVLGNVLGSSDPNKREVPWFYMKVLGGAFGALSSSASDTFTDLNGVVHNIPQINYSGSLGAELVEVVDNFSETKTSKMKFFATENFILEKDSFQVKVLTQQSGSGGEKLYDYFDYHKGDKGFLATYATIIGALDFDNDIEDYDDLLNEYYLDIMDNDNRVYFVKEQLKLSEQEKQPRGDIYEVDDPGEICDD